MKRIMKTAICILACIVLLTCLLTMAFSSFADAGNFSGNSDYGGGSSGGSWGGDSWSGSDYSSGGDSFYEGDDISIPWPIAVVIVIIVVVIAMRFFRHGVQTPAAPGAAPTDYSELRSMGEFKEMDPAFTEEAFTEKLSNLYVQLQNQWQAKEFEPMRAHMTDALYNQFARQLEMYIANHQTNFVERIAVLGVDLMGWTQDEVNDVIVARLRTRIVDYVVDDGTGEVISGSDTAEKFMDYEWTMIRRTGITTPEADHPSSLHCPSCGAPMDVNYSAKCEYCGSVLVNSDYDWVLSAVKGISQRTGV